MNGMKEAELTAVKVLYAIGFGVALFCLSLQAAFYALVPASRKLDQKILSQLTATRLLYIAAEYVVHYVPLNTVTRNVAFEVYMHTDAVLICWMFVFTKNLYEKVINVFVKKMSFVLVSVAVWLITLPLGLMCPLLLALVDSGRIDADGFEYFYKVYGVLKFTILSVNLLLFLIIFRVAIRRSDRSVCLLRTCIVSFVIVCISSLQVLLTDLFSFFWDSNEDLSTWLSAVNTFQPVAITSLFLILVHALWEDSLQTTIMKKFCKQVI